MSDFNNGTENFGSTQPTEEFHTNPSNYNTSPSLEQPPKKPKTALFIVLAIIVVLLGGSITAFACVPSISNQVYLAVLSPKKYYLKLEKKAIEDMSSTISSAYGKEVAQIKKANNPVATSTNMKFSVNDSYVSALGLSKVFPIELKNKTSLDLKNKKEKVFMELLLGNESFGSLNMLMDISKENFGSSYIQIPELNEAYIGIFPDDLEENTDLTSEEDAAMEQAQKFYETYLSDPTSEKLVQTLLSRYSNIIIKNVNNVVLNKNTEVSANGATAKNTKIVVTLTTAEIKAIAKEIVDTAKNDTDLKNELIRLSLCTEEQYNTAMEEAAKGVEELTDAEKGQLIMTVWADQNGKITGRDITLESEDEEPITFSYHTVKEKNTTSLESSMTSDGITNLIVKGKNTNEKGISNGDITAELNGDGASNYSAAVTYDSVKTTNKDLGYFSGNFNFSVTQVPSASLKLTAAGTEKDQKLLFEAIALGQNLGSLEITTAEAAYEDFSFPDSKNVYSMNDETAGEKYMETANQEYITKVQNKVNEISEAVSNALGGSDGPISLFPSIDGTEDDTIGETDDDTSLFDDENEAITEDDMDDTTDTEDDTDTDSQTSDGFTINPNPQTKDDLPSNADVDNDGYYSYELTDDQVMANGEHSNTGTYYSSLVFTDIKDDLYDLFTETLGENWGEPETTSYNSVSGILGEDDVITTLFSSSASWSTDIDSDYQSFRVEYDTYSKEISEFSFTAVSKENGYNLMNKLLSMTEDDFTEKDFESIREKLDAVKKGKDTYFEFGNSNISYSVSDDESTYNFSISAAYQ